MKSAKEIALEAVRGLRDGEEFSKAERLTKSERDLSI